MVLRAQSSETHRSQVFSALVDGVVTRRLHV
jgi:hypothetical protein